MEGYFEWHDSDSNQADPGHVDQNQPCSGSGDMGSDNSDEQQI